MQSMQPEPADGRRLVVRGGVALALLGGLIPLGRYVIGPLFQAASLDTRLFLALAMSPVAMVLIILAVAPRPLRESLAWPGPPIRWASTAGNAVVLIFLVILLTGLSLLVLRGLNAGGGSERQQILAAILASKNSGLRLALLLVAVGVAPVLEELFFRGLIFSAFTSWGTTVARAISAVTFALAHVEPVGFVGFVIVGWYLGGLRARTGSVRASIALHAVYNGLLVAFVLLATLAQRQLVPGSVT